MISLATGGFRKGGERGFSLIEILCAVLVLGIALTGLTEGITVSLRTAKEAEYHTSAVLLAAGSMETLRAEGDFIVGEETGDFGRDFPLYRWRRTIRETGLRGLYELRVEVVLDATEKPLYALETFLFQMPSSFDLDGRGTETSTERRRRRTGERRGLGRTGR